MRASCSSSSGRAAVLPVLHDEQQIGAVLERAEVGRVATVVRRHRGASRTSAHRSRPSRISAHPISKTGGTLPKDSPLAAAASDEVGDRQRFHLIAEADELVEQVRPDQTLNLRRLRATREHIVRRCPRPVVQKRDLRAPSHSVLPEARSSGGRDSSRDPAECPAQVEGFRGYLLAALGIESNGSFDWPVGARGSRRERWRFWSGQLATPAPSRFAP